MSPLLIFLSFLAYTILVFLITWVTARKADNDSFFIGNKHSPWPVVAYGMIGASLSGVTFMSVPGVVEATGFKYFGLVIGFVLGYVVIATVLLPLYYRLNLTSIYTYLEKRFGFWSYKTGAFFFLLSRTVIASFRMFLVVNVLQFFVFNAWGVPFIVTVSIFILLILLYTFKGGIKTIIWTDALQTTFMLAAVVVALHLICKEMGLSFGGLVQQVSHSKYSTLLEVDWHARDFFLKQLLSGAFIAIAMTGLDQEMMQKNLSCRNLRDAQKNMFSFSIILVFVNLLFLFLGGALFLFATQKGITLPANTDDVFPVISINHLGPLAGLVFVIGLISAAYPSADGALTSLTTTVSIDFIGLDKKENLTELQKRRYRYLIHVSFALLLLGMIVVFNAINDRAVIDKLYTVVGYTYGPLLGLFSFGLFTKRRVRDKWVPWVALISPLMCYFLSEYSRQLFSGYTFGFELLIVNGAISFLGMWLLSYPAKEKMLPF
ncbi:MAG: sodium:solute symporter [Bacteroidota bacterium]|nr:sodium:solute symporter [Bacteroidota bacterium]